MKKIIDNLTLLEKYDVPGPRYTSYPTVPAWSEKISAADYQKSLNALSKNQPLSLYFHLPFCKNLCHFCGCTQVITKDTTKAKSYLEVLLKEINLVKNRLENSDKKVTQLHLGGGTPNFFAPELLEDLITHVKNDFSFLADAELAIEMHPNTSTTAFNQSLKKLGFNRISLGVQDFDPHVQKLINRNQSFQTTKEMIFELRGLGFDSFNFDLVYGLPGQTKEGWLKTLERTKELNPDRLAVYSYAHVPWVRPVQRTFKDSDLPSPKQKIDFFNLAYEFFLKNNYELIGMDHFAKKTDELSTAKHQNNLHRNFMGYSTKALAHQIGFGMSAISYVNNNYFQNQKRLQDYQASITNNNFATFRGFLLTPEDQMIRALITELMCHAQIDIKNFEKNWKIDFKQEFQQEMSQLDSFIEDSILELEPNFIKTTPSGALFLRNIAMLFDRHLNSIQQKAKNPVFSKTV